ncbi:MAG: rRNA maturation RNase YbeY [Candidatus Zambryskibacteria bacterium RIFCSPLOWO2_01_FULL_45_43]|uniref:Endoribonuclease YbeY n=2 Tax=Parcubacteria group TaxID=1794811 RepID=A0A1G1ZSL9_9BACT|nr:MAG: rRNA maturation RNase YbeY [Candidatus Harrisonbacteria bacterium RIFCSPLOWO2_02_FULL_45_10c]OHB06081.1 MAG: rRNA maturation RNase YbeY [Candidatus Zambryskibacteria bacterium RIFCSPLOWO2_01_FULL_45_43]
MRIEVILLDKEVKKFGEATKKIACQLNKLLKNSGSAEVYLINSRRMQHLNKAFRKKDKSTNVLSFQKPKGFPGKELGEVYLDPLYIRKHKEDLALMLVHGVLHILGYDHLRKGDRIKMEKMENRLLKKMA